MFQLGETGADFLLCPPGRTLQTPWKQRGDPEQPSGCFGAFPDNSRQFCTLCSVPAQFSLKALGMVLQLMVLWEFLKISLLIPMEIIRIQTSLFYLTISLKLLQLFDIMASIIRYCLCFFSGLKCPEPIRNKQDCQTFLLTFFTAVQYFIFLSSQFVKKQSQRNKPYFEVMRYIFIIPGVTPACNEIFALLQLS